MSGACCNLEATKTFVEGRSAVGKADKNGDTPLLLAARYGKLQVFRYLTEIGAEISICDFQNNTVLHSSAFSCRVGIIKILLDNGMSVDR